MSVPIPMTVAPSQLFKNFGAATKFFLLTQARFTRRKRSSAFWIRLRNLSDERATRAPSYYAGDMSGSSLRGGPSSRSLSRLATARHYSFKERVRRSSTLRGRRDIPDFRERVSSRCFPGGPY